jgi:hypothetical protein
MPAEDTTRTLTIPMKHSLRNTFLLAALVGLISSAFAQAPTTTYAVGVHVYNWTRGSRSLPTYVFYPAATGTPGGSAVTDAPPASGTFPIYQYSHGLGGDPANSTFAPGLASAGFIVPAPHFQHTLNDVNSGETSRDVSQVITNTLALNSSGLLAGHVRTDIGVGVCGHSMGGMATDGLLTSWPDSRIISAIPMSCLDMGTPSSSVHAKVMFIHGDQDGTTSYSSGRQAYSEMPAPKAFLTFIGGSHTSFWDDPIFRTTVKDWARWTMYNDTAAHDRLAGDATSTHSKWEIVESGQPSTFPAAGTYSLRCRTSNLMLDNLGVSNNGANVGEWSDGSSTNQRWVLSYVSSSVVKLQCVTGGRYLDGMGRTSAGSNVGQYDNSTSNNQRWTIIDVGGGFFKLKNVGTGLCLDVGSSPWPNGDLVQQYADGTSQNQHWQFVAP